MTVIWIPKSFKGKIKEMTRAKKIVFEIFIFHTLNMAALNLRAPGSLNAL